MFASGRLYYPAIAMLKPTAEETCRSGPKRLSGLSTGMSRVRRTSRNTIREEQHMADQNSGPAEGVKGAVEDVKGKAKEAVGTVTGHDDLAEEGRAQQDKADAQRDVAKKEAEAEAARGGAKAAEKREQAHQH
jgi:uncharacterized protein YjbJ (UPF0337 family)